MSETVNLVVTTLAGRSEVEVPSDFISATGVAPSRQLVSFLRESEIEFPAEGMVTRTEGGFTLHEVPKFG